MSDVFLLQLDIPEPDANLDVGSASHAQQTAEVMSRFEPVVLEKAGPRFGLRSCQFNRRSGFGLLKASRSGRTRRSGTSFVRSNDAGGD